MWNDSYVRSLPGLRLGGGPVQSVQNVLAKGGEQTVCHLREKISAFKYKKTENHC